MKVRWIKVECVSETQQYENDIIISDKELNAVNSKPKEFYGEWTHIISPNL
jgi:hypothetical protein